MQTYNVNYGYKVSVTIRRTDSTAYVRVNAPFYKNKAWYMSHCYSAVFTDQQILNDSDFIRVLSNAFGPIN